MPKPYLVKPDREFVQRVLGEGGEDLKKCFQCATCSVVCELSDGSKPFPRKEMIWAQWGLKDRLAADPDIWLCHQCNDCSTRCPRGARPGDVLSALRQEAVQHYAVPSLLGKWANSVKHLPVMLLIPVVLLVLALLAKTPIWEATGGKEGWLSFLHHKGFYADLYPHWLLIGFYSTFWGLSMLAAAAGVLRFWRAMKAADEATGGYTPELGIVSSTIRVLASLFRHDKFSKCDAQASRRTAHMGAFYGFAALFIVSVWAVIALYMINPFMPEGKHLHYPFAFTDPLGSPWKILANLGAIALIAGCVIAIRNRMSDKEGSSASSPFDWLFLWLVLIVGVSGLLTEIMRFVAEPSGATGLRHLAYGVYFVHLVAVFDLLVYLPFSKFAHIVYRSVALVYAEHTGRTKGAAENE